MLVIDFEQCFQSIAQVDRRADRRWRRLSNDWGFMRLDARRCARMARDESSSAIVSSAEGKRTERFSEKSSRYRDSLRSEVRLPRDERHFSSESNEQLRNKIHDTHINFPTVLIFLGNGLQDQGHVHGLATPLDSTATDKSWPYLLTS